MIVDTLAVGPLRENCYLVVDDASGEAAVIDPGDEGERICAAVAARGARLTAIWLTHAHFDHIGGIAAIRRVHDVPIYLHPAERPLYDLAVPSAAGFGLVVEPPPPPDRALAGGDELALGALRFAVVDAPGHAPGHVVLVGQGIAFVGDCIFAGSVGRTDLPLSDARVLASTLARLCELPPATVLYPGHGPPTTLAAELAANPFLNGSVRLVRT